MEFQAIFKPKLKLISLNWAPDLEEILEMALSGRVYVFGEAKELVTPIWGGDLAHAIVDALEQEQVRKPRPFNLDFIISWLPAPRFGLLTQYLVI